MIHPIQSSHLLGCKRQDAAELPPSCPSVYPMEAVMGCSWSLFVTCLPHKYPQGSSTRAKTLLKAGVEQAERGVRPQTVLQTAETPKSSPLFLLLPKQLLRCL